MILNVVLKTTASISSREVKASNAADIEVPTVTTKDVVVTISIRPWK